MNERFKEFRDSIGGFFNETDLRQEQPKNNPAISRGRMHKGTLYVYVNGKRTHYIKKGEFVEGYVGKHVSSNNHQTSNQNSNIDRFEIRMKKGTTEQMAKNKKEKPSLKKKIIVGFIVGMVLIASISKHVYGNTIENNGEQTQNNQNNFMDRLEKGNLSNDELQDIIKEVIKHIECDKLKNPISQRFNVPPENVIIDPNNPYSITIIDEYSKINGAWSVKEGENVHRVSALIGQLILDLKILYDLLNSSQPSNEYIRETVKRITNEVESISPDGGIIMTDGNGEIQRINSDVDMGVDYDEFLKYLESQQGGR